MYMNEPQLKPKYHCIVKIIELMKSHTIETRSAFMGILNLNDGVDGVTVITVGVYPTGDSFCWFLDDSKFNLVSFVNEETKIMAFPVGEHGKFTDALMELQDDFASRGNPTTMTHHRVG